MSLTALSLKTLKMRKHPLVQFCLLALVLVAPPHAKLAASEPPSLFERKNIVAWCIVPFDSVKRGPAERAEMVRQLGITKVAYDWRGEHVPQFEQEILEYKKRGLEYFAFWSLHEEAFRLFEKYQLHPQIWILAPSPAGTLTRDQQIKEASTKLLPLVERTRKLGCQLGLYNHGDWGGEPENLVAVCEYLRQHHGATHVGIVYNQHHGHSHVDRFAAALALMKPYLLCLNLNGLTRDGDKRGRKIQPVGQGELDLPMLKIIATSGYRGPIGIIGHTNDDVDLRLRDNLEGLDWLVPQLSAQPAGPKPTPRLPLLPKSAAPAQASAPKK
jgi:hypothetical protein